MTLELKHSLYQHSVKLISGRISDLHQEIREVGESASSDTKSSMGDKYETGREMVTQEINRLSAQLLQNEKLKKALDLMDLQTSETIQLGSLVKTSGDTYFLSIPVGQLEVDGKSFFLISPGSPIGQLMLGNSAGSEVTFNNRRLQILEVV